MEFFYMCSSFLNVIKYGCQKCKQLVIFCLPTCACISVCIWNKYEADSNITKVLSNQVYGLHENNALFF